MIYHEKKNIIKFIIYKCKINEKIKIFRKIESKLSALYFILKIFSIFLFKFFLVSNTLF